MTFGSLTMSSQRLTIWRHSKKSYRMPHMKNTLYPQKKDVEDDSDILRGRGSSWVLGVVTVNKLVCLGR